MNLQERIEALFAEGEDVLKNNPNVASIGYKIEDVSLDELESVGQHAPYIIGNQLRRNIFHPDMSDKICVQLISVPVKLKSQTIYEPI